MEKNQVNKEEFIKRMNGDNEELRLRVMKEIKWHELTINDAADEIGISAMTLASFLRTDKKIDLKTAHRIEKWVDTKE
jgi:plasmid maintenance system antidote protein VapI